jgi:hypothetical protein
VHKTAECAALGELVQHARDHGLGDEPPDRHAPLRGERARRECRSEPRGRRTMPAERTARRSSARAHEVGRGVGARTDDEHLLARCARAQPCARDGEPIVAPLETTRHRPADCMAAEYTLGSILPR